MTEKITVIFGRNKKPGSLAIRLFCWSRWSHCGILHGNTVIEAIGSGVVTTHIDDFKARYPKIAIAELHCEDANHAISTARQQLGKPYDRLAILGLAFRTGWQHKDKWFCSELIAYCSGRFRTDRISRVTPEHIWMVSR